MMLRFRETTEADLDYVLEAEQHPDNRSFIIPWSRQQHQQAIADVDIAHWLVQTHMNVGFVIMAGLCNPNDSLEFRRIVITEKGQGYGKATIEEIKKLAFEAYHAHRLWLDVKEQNHRAQALYAKAGFVVEGALRDCLKTTNGYESLILMSILRSEYE